MLPEHRTDSPDGSEHPLPHAESAADAFDGEVVVWATFRPMNSPLSTTAMPTSCYNRTSSSRYHHANAPQVISTIHKFGLATPEVQRPTEHDHDREAKHTRHRCIEPLQ
jgi:hypothetical protein